MVMYMAQHAPFCHASLIDDTIVQQASPLLLLRLAD
jgi:hypothetical protein